MDNYEIRPVRNAIVMLTNQCNCRCVYCFEQHKPGHMSLDTAKDVLRFLHMSGSQNIGFTFFGGEPMLEFDTVIVPLVEWSKTAFDHQTRFAMTTNGTLFTKERLDFLYRHSIRFMLSMDGASTAQGMNRPLANGKNSFDAIAPYISYVLKLWPDQSFRETLTQHNVDSFFDDIMYFRDIGCVNLMVVPDIFEVWSDEKIDALGEQIAKYEAYLTRCFQSGKFPLIIHEYVMAFRKLSQLANNPAVERRSMDSCHGCYKCGFGIMGSVSIDPSGNIYGCHHISPLDTKSEYYLGDIYSGIEEWRVRRLADRYDRLKVGNEMCQSCGLDKICDGGCAPNNYQINGDEHKVPAMYCVWWRTVMDSAYRLCYALADNELFQDTFHRCAGGGSPWQIS